ncbi:hypothetical protein OC834_001916 [Tilletia horrida]|uniref:Uncharacterized protein n=1 Tax=Tilletia horrida TaxID=155126 RepID=A0AAN6G6K9_9BASI|nr:hypothetical protein OC842_006085 [Tilletia horrida]KAK0534347.1 hypothetical protein OC834_001916 [Tilletia horrida]KAK0540222.1 hypothetical protein OC835_000753 [Tilletia horrida]KAK0550056.1 hypothetical protein OC844_006776 [Tilletia horrida]
MARDKKTPSSNLDILLYFLAIFLPPASVGIKRGCGADVIINIALTVLAWLPGLIHAWYIVAKYPEPDTTHAHRVADASATAGTSTATPYYHEHAARNQAYGATIPAAAPPAQAAYHQPAPAPAYQPPAGGPYAPTKN